MTLQRHAPLRRRARKVRASRKQPARRCGYVAPGRTSGRCSRPPLRWIDLCRTHLTECMDRVAGDRVKERDGWACVRIVGHDAAGKPLHCGRTTELTWSHRALLNRHYRGTRWMMDAADAHCWPCHFYLGAHPLEHYEDSRERFGSDEAYEEMRAIAREFAAGRAVLDLEATARAFGITDAATACALMAHREAA